MNTKSLTHITINTGHISRTCDITPPTERAAVVPLIYQGGDIPSHDGFRVAVERRDCFAFFDIFYQEHPLTRNVLAWDVRGSVPAWKLATASFFDGYQALADTPVDMEPQRSELLPSRPLDIPLLTTVLLPTLADAGFEMLFHMVWIGAFERIFAEALLDDVTGSGSEERSLAA